VNRGVTLIHWYITMHWDHLENSELDIYANRCIQWIRITILLELKIQALFQKLFLLSIHQL
jgi:hypothetical protein